MGNCVVCGKDLGDRSKRTKYCSTACRGKHNRDKFIDKSLIYDVQLRREEIILIKGGSCFFCNSQEKLQIHHLNYDNNDLDNLRVLCLKCHSKLHSILTKMVFSPQNQPVKEIKGKVKTNTHKRKKVLKNKESLK